MAEGLSGKHSSCDHTPQCAVSEVSLVWLQEPAPEVNKLRQGECWRASQLQIFPEEATPLEGVAGAALDIVCVLERCELTILPCHHPTL